MLHIALIIIRNHDGKFLLQFRDGKAPVNKLLWTFFGGAAEEGEDPALAAVREVQEELNLIIRETDLRLVTRKPWVHEGLGVDETIVLFELATEVRWDMIEIREGAGGAFLTKEEALSLPNLTPLARELIGENL